MVQTLKVRKKKKIVDADVTLSVHKMFFKKMFIKAILTKMHLILIIDKKIFIENNLLETLLT